VSRRNEYVVSASAQRRQQRAQVRFGATFGIDPFAQHQ
jgi:hypothetical protein